MSELKDFEGVDVVLGHGGTPTLTGFGMSAVTSYTDSEEGIGQFVDRFGTVVNIRYSIQVGLIRRNLRISSNLRM